MAPYKAQAKLSSTQKLKNMGLNPSGSVLDKYTPSKKIPFYEKMSGSRQNQPDNGLSISGSKSKHRFDRFARGGRVKKGDMAATGGADDVSEYARGGRTKGKTNVNVIIAPQGGGGGAAGGAPVAPPMPRPMAPPPAMPPAGGPPPGAVPPGPMAGPPPMRARGGFVKMRFAAGGGKGRIEKERKYGKNALAKPKAFG